MEKGISLFEQGKEAFRMWRITPHSVYLVFKILGSVMPV